MYKVLVLEDEQKVAQRLMDYVDKYAKEHDVSLEATWVSSAIELYAEKHPADLFLMDIQLPGINGLEAAELLRSYDEDVPIIFVTNLAQYAVKAYKVDALDFLVKPVQYADFCMAMDRAVKRIKRNSKRTISVQTKDGVYVVNVLDIVYIDVLNHNSSVHMSAGEVLNSRSPLGTFEKELGSEQFTRTSKSCIVNMGHVRRIAGDALHMSDGTVLYLSRSRKKPALVDMTRFLGEGA